MLFLCRLYVRKGSKMIHFLSSFRVWQKRGKLVHWVYFWGLGGMLAHGGGGGKGLVAGDERL